MRSRWSEKNEMEEATYKLREALSSTHGYADMLAVRELDSEVRINAPLQADDLDQMPAPGVVRVGNGDKLGRRVSGGGSLKCRSLGEGVAATPPPYPTLKRRAATASRAPSTKARTAR